MARLNSVSLVAFFYIIQSIVADINYKASTNGTRVYKPRVLYFTSNNTIRNTFYEGDSLSLTCVKNTSERIDNRLVWKWKPIFFRNSEAKELNDHFRPPNTKVSIDVNYTEANGVHSVASRLHLSPITRNSSGSYICYDRTDQKVLSSFHLTNIQQAPAFVTPQRSKFLIGHLPSGDKFKVFSETVPPGSRFRLSCELGQPVTNATQSIPYGWHFMPKGLLADPKTYYGNEALPWEARWKTYVIGPQRNQWMFEVQNATFLDTGLYACIDYERDQFNSEYYIFVKDKTQMILPPNEESVKLRGGGVSKGVYVFRSQPENFVQHHNLGCGPTDPFVTVELWDMKGVKLASSNDSYSSVAKWTFNPIQGFQLNNKAIAWDVEGDYVCSTADRRQKRRFQIIVIGIDVYAERGKTNNPNEFVLTCEGRTFESEAADLAWYWKSSSAFPEASHTYVTDERIRSWNCANEDYYDEKSNVFVNRIICENEPTEAAGSFECKDRYRRFPPARYNLVVHSETSSSETLPHDLEDYVFGPAL